MGDLLTMIYDDGWVLFESHENFIFSCNSDASLQQLSKNWKSRNVANNVAMWSKRSDRSEVREDLVIDWETDICDSNIAFTTEKSGISTRIRDHDVSILYYTNKSIQFVLL